MYRTIRKQRDHLVQLALERDQAVLCMAAVKVENEDLHGQLAKYGQVIKAYGTQHTPPSRKRSTLRRRNEKRITPPAGAANMWVTKVYRPAGKHQQPL